MQKEKDKLSNFFVKQYTFCKAIHNCFHGLNYSLNCFFELSYFKWSGPNTLYYFCRPQTCHSGPFISNRVRSGIVQTYFISLWTSRQTGGWSNISLSPW